MPQQTQNVVARICKFGRLHDMEIALHNANSGMNLMCEWFYDLSM